ncbi:CMRF35-like molecule 1 [Perca fluviatilis]|uniref:CMRF35-like molecule 1 n=1 Tax=Perca fluviatilis TaxID=8168 RepID=UPI00196333EE|nr:CMRF35-like molecule 1 [Perca fluviatilis]
MKTIYIFYCLLYAAGIEGTDINVEGFEGEEVSFQCSHRLAWRNNKYFCKDPCKGIEDILVTVQSGRRVESGRIALVDSGDGVFTVTISQLQLSDLGRYWCAVDRPGFDTFTAVHLTVKEVYTTVPYTDETKTVIPEPSPTWTHQNISNSTQFTSGMDTSRPANFSTALNSTNGGQNTITGTVLYATVGAVAVLTMWVLTAMLVRNRRENGKLQPQVCSDSTDLVSADKRGGNTNEVQSFTKLSERFSRTHHPKQDPPTAPSTAAECSVPMPIYENIPCSTGTAHSRYSVTNVQDAHDISPRIYIKPLPPISERTREGYLRKHTNKPTSNTNAISSSTESCTSSASACHSRSYNDCTEVRPTSLWFGLDLSETA